MSWLKVMFHLFDWVWQLSRQKCSYLTRNILLNLVYKYESAFELFSPISDFLKIATMVSYYRASINTSATTNNTQLNWMAYATTDDMLFYSFSVFFSTSLFLLWKYIWTKKMHEKRCARCNDTVNGKKNDSCDVWKSQRQKYPVKVNKNV